MRITSKGQVTIPREIRERAGLLPSTDVEFRYAGNGEARILRARKDGKKARPNRGERIVARATGTSTVKMTTEEIMALMRGE